MEEADYNSSLDVEVEEVNSSPQTPVAVNVNVTNAEIWFVADPTKVRTKGFVCTSNFLVKYFTPNSAGNQTSILVKNFGFYRTTFRQVPTLNLWNLVELNRFLFFIF